MSSRNSKQDPTNAKNQVASPIKFKMAGLLKEIKERWRLEKDYLESLKDCKRRLKRSEITNSLPFFLPSFSKIYATSPPDRGHIIVSQHL